MFKIIRRKYLSATQLNTLNLSISTLALLLSSYLEYAKPTLGCAFCLTLRLLFLVSIGSSLGALFIPAHRRIVYPSQLGCHVVGLLLSLRQFYFEQFGSRFASCAKPASHSLMTIFNWLYAGAPVCRKTMLLGPLTLAGWGCLLFGVLLFISTSLYLRKSKRRIRL